MDDAWYRPAAGETIMQGLVALAIGVPLLACVEGARAARRAVAWCRRWPMPERVGGLTGGLDGVPPRRPTMTREAVEGVLADAKARRN